MHSTAHITVRPWHSSLSSPSRGHHIAEEAGRRPKSCRIVGESGECRLKGVWLEDVPLDCHVGANELKTGVPPADYSVSHIGTNKLPATWPVDTGLIMCRRELWNNSQESRFCS
jgi:hypothetical protein